MRLHTAVLLLAVSSLAFGQAPQKGIEVSDLDRKVDPCTDFFEYSNGAWRAANPIPASMDRWSRRWKAGEDSKTLLKDLLDGVSRQRRAAQGSVEQLIGDHYAACMDEARINQLGMKPIAPLMAEIGALKTKADVERMIRRFHDLNIDVPFGFTGSPDNHQPTQTIADIYASGLGLPDRDYYFKTEPRFVETRAKYKEHVANMFKLAGYSEKRAQRAAEAVFGMETRLAGKSLDNVALRDPRATDHKTSVAELQKLTPHFDWATYFKATGLPAADLNVQEPAFLQEVDRQLVQDPLISWKTYLKWHLLRSAAMSLSQPFVDESFNFNQRYLAGAKELKPRWKRCVESTDRLLGEALGKKYVEKYFPPAAKARMQELVANLRLAMKETIESLAWMSPETKKKALEKLSTFNPKIGYPDTWKDYSHVLIRRDNYWADVVAGRRFNVDDDRSTIGKPTDRGRWYMTPPTSNAYYNPLLNEIVFPAGILQPPAFNLEATDAVNYGSSGVVMGHEISHGFDDSGAQYDSLGRLNNWWTADDLKQFTARGQCVVDQFESYFIETNIHHDGKLVLGESIGDLAGAKIAYRAFQIAQRGKTPSQGS